MTLALSNCDRGINNNVLVVFHNTLFVLSDIEGKNNSSVYLGLNHSLWNIVHGIGKPTFKAFCKIANGLGQGTYVQKNIKQMKKNQGMHVLKDSCP